MTRARKTFLAVLAGAVSLLLSGTATARPIELAPSDLAVYAAGGALYAEQYVQIHGSIAASGYLSFERSAMITGDVHAGGDADFARSANVSGRIIAGNSVWVDRYSTVGDIDAGGSATFGKQVTSGRIKAGGYVNVGSKMIVNGDVHGGGSIDINSNAFVHGDVTHASGYWKHHTATVDGQITQGQTGPDVDTWTGSTLTAGAVSGVSGSQSYGAGSVTYLAPGDYGRLDFGSGATLYLTGAGEYNFRGLEFADDVQVVADVAVGDVEVNVQTDFNTGARLDMSRVGEHQLVVQAGGYTGIGIESTIDGSLAGYGLWVDVHDGTTINGYVYSAGNIWLGDSVVVAGKWRPNHAPEPTTMVLLAAGAILLVARRRHFA